MISVLVKMDLELILIKYFFRLQVGLDTLPVRTVKPDIAIKKQATLLRFRADQEQSLKSHLARSELQISKKMREKIFPQP